MYVCLRWCSGQPSKGYDVYPFEKCATMKSCGLNDVDCGDHLKYICEFTALEIRIINIFNIRNYK